MGRELAYELQAFPYEHWFIMLLLKRMYSNYACEEDFVNIVTGDDTNG